ncbi:MAG: aminotransferase class I/II-fold pyridoxal phosphate-dependent enzyme [Defluviitaleaceae bacterium]|nr:aminotransferase class I/II-fold pyridoxal phosphate-dependent enzyme [Defluviitaleaceae bacterium]
MYEHINAYLNKDIYPFHMPGHKRNTFFLPPDPISLDLTEIPGMDVLHEPTGLLRDMQADLAAFFNADESFLLVNGSTAGIVAAICAASADGGTLFAARNGHASMYNGLVLAGTTPRYFYPRIRTDGLIGGVDPHILDDMPRDVSAVFVVSPTYEGFTSDIEAIAKRVHKKNAILIIDEAHGAHFPFHKSFPRSALNQGADIVINSLHKTLPTLGQTAVLHVRGNRVDRARLRFYLNAVQTTSPSYILMGATDYTLKLLWQTPKLFDDYVKRLNALRENLGEQTPSRTERKLINLLPCAHGDDPSKLLFEVSDPNLTQRINETFADEYKIQLEMAWGSHILAMTSVADTDEGFSRLLHAVREINGRANGDCRHHRTPLARSSVPAATEALPPIPKLPEIVFPPRTALQQPAETIPLPEAAGCISAELIAPCPPGIALVAPGERIPAGLPLQRNRIRVIIEK